MDAPDRPRAFYSAFLNAQGRLLQDVFIYALPFNSEVVSREGNSDPLYQIFLIEVDARQSSKLTNWLKKYRLRSKIAIRELPPDYIHVYSAWDDTRPFDTFSRDLRSSVAPLASILTTDQRAPSFGARLISTHSKPVPLDIASHTEYAIRRYLYGIPEGQVELPIENAFPHESCIDYMGGVDFRKGCYVGQELVIRTQHTGVVRKRVLPCMIYDELCDPPQKLSYDEEASKRLLARMNVAHQNFATDAIIPYGADIKSNMDSGRKARSKGKWLGGIGNVGLALCRLEEMVGIGPAGEKVESWEEGNRWRLEWLGQSDESKHLRIKPFVPYWWAERTRRASPQPRGGLGL